MNTIKTFLDTLNIKDSKGRQYLETLLKTQKAPYTPTTSIYKNIANIHNTTPTNVEFNIRYIKSKIKPEGVGVFSRPPSTLYNRDFIIELIIAYNKESKNPNITINKEW